MIELLDAKITSKNAPKEKCSFSFEKGLVNYVDYSEKYKYDFLLLKDQSLDEGTFKIDEYQVYPQESNEDSLFFLAVNSLVKTGLCFVCKNNEKKEKVKTVQQELIKLRDLPAETDEDKLNKVTAIFSCIKSLNPSYVLIDLNQEFVINNKVFINNELDKLATDVLVVALNEKPIAEIVSNEEEENVVYELNIGNAKERNVASEKKKHTSVISSNGNSFGKTFASMFKENYMVFLSFIAPALGVIAFSLLSPLYGQTNKVLLIPFIITIIICFVLYMIMTYKCAEFENKHQLIAYAILNLASLTIAFGLSILFYFLFLNFDAEIKALNSKNITGFTIAIIFTLVLMTACLYVPPIGKAILKLFKKKK